MEGERIEQTFDNFDGVQVSLPSCVEVEQFLSVPYKSAQVDRQSHL